MKTKVLVISPEGKRLENALILAEKAAKYNKMTDKGAMHLRLLTEEMINMMRSITGTEEGRFWIEEENDLYQIHLHVKTEMDIDKRESLMSASKSGRNEASKGFMGRLRTFFDRLDDADVPANFSADSKTGYMSWSMRDYEASLRNDVRHKPPEVWDELEKSVVFHLADDVKVSIRGEDVEMVIYKKMK